MIIIINCLRGFTFNLININNTRIYKDSNKVKIVQELRNHVAILKPSKSNGTNIENYSNSVKHLLKDSKNFQNLDIDPKITRMKSLHRYLKALQQANEITKTEFGLTRSKYATQATKQGLPGIYEKFTNILKFRPIIDTTGTNHSPVSKYLAYLLYLLITNEFSLKKSFKFSQLI